MTAQKEYFVYLLSCFLSGNQPEGREADFKELYRLADIHDVGAIIAQEISLLPPEYQPDAQYHSYFRQVIGRTLQSYEKKLKAYQFIQQFLEKYQFDHLFVKGILVKDYYPIPEFRTSGDIDIIIRPDELPRLKSVLEQAEIHIVDYVTETITVRIFDTMIEIHSTADVLSDYFDNIFTLCEKISDYSYQLNEYDHLLYVLCHLAKHLSYRGAGIRMLMDMDAVIRGNKHFDAERFLLLCEKAGVKKTAQVILSLCHLWFDTPVSAYIDFKENETLLHQLETVFLDGGSFGYESSAIPAKYYEAGQTNSKFLILLKMAFPSRDYLKIAYPYYQKHWYLYPIARMNRLIDGLFKKRKNTSDALKQIRSDSQITVQLQLLQELDIKHKTE